MPAEVQSIKVPTINLEWSNWIRWDKVAIEWRSSRAVHIPASPGVYEVCKSANSGKRLTIGKAVNLQRRVRSGLVRGTASHSTGTRIRKHESCSKLLIRWAETKVPSCVEEQLHQIYKQNYGTLPQYTKVT